MNNGGDDQDDTLDLNTVIDTQDDDLDTTDRQDDDGEEETVVIFGDGEGADPEPETPLIKQLREQIRTLSKKVKHAPAQVADDPEPVVPPIKRLEDFDYDDDKHDAYIAERDRKVEERAEWKVRQSQREQQKADREAQQAQAIEQQRRALNVHDYDVASAKVRDRLSETQINILVTGTDNPAALIYALGKSETRLDQIAGEDNLAKFAVMLGKLEKDMKVMKRKAPAPETLVRGATATNALGSDKELERLEKEAEKTGDRSKVIAYRRSQRQAA